MGEDVADPMAALVEGGRVSGMSGTELSGYVVRIRGIGVVEDGGVDLALLWDDRMGEDRSTHESKDG